MDKLESIAGRLARGFNRLAGDESPEQLLEAATLVSQLADEMEAPSAEPFESFELRAKEIRTVLVVEAFPDDRRSLRETLTRQGYAVLEAATGEEALAVCAAFSDPIHVLLTDVLLQEMSGPELAERCTATQPGISAVYMSGYTEEALGCGILSPTSAYVRKPVITAQLAERLAALTEVQFAGR